MFYKKKLSGKYIKYVIFVSVLVLNFILLSKITTNTKNEYLFEKHIRK